MWALYRTFFISHVQYVLCHSRPKKPLLLGLVYVLPYHRRHERRAAAAATRRAAGCPSPRVWYEFLVSFDNRWPRVMIAITVHGSKNIYLLYVIMQRTYTVHILVTRCLMVSTNQADPSCFYFRSSWILMERRWLYFFRPLYLLQGLRSNNIK